MRMRKIKSLLSIILITAFCSSCNVPNKDAEDNRGINSGNVIAYPLTPQNNFSIVTTSANTSKISGKQTSNVPEELTTQAITTVLFQEFKNVTIEKNYTVTSANNDTEIMQDQTNNENESNECYSNDLETNIAEPTTTKIEDVTEYQSEESIEGNQEVDLNMQDCVILNDQVIQIVYAPANQSNVDKYDVVQDTEYWTTEKDKYLYGHDYRSFFWLKYVEVGDTVTLINGGVKNEYTVIRSEIGKLTEDMCDVRSTNDDTSLILGDFNCETLRMMTCVSGISTSYRLVVICEKN